MGVARAVSTCITGEASSQGRLNQWAHWARAQGPGLFFFLRGPQLAVVKEFFKTNYLISFAKINCKGNLVNTF